MKLKSEAQAYQQIRRSWKKLRNKAQRTISLYQWELAHKDKHPQIKRIFIKALGNNVHIPISRDTICRREAGIASMKVSKYQRLLNTYKVS